MRAGALVSSLLWLAAVGSEAALTDSFEIDTGWARVARLMGVTRRIIYLRLQQRYGIPCERVPKTCLRPASA